MFNFDQMKNDKIVNNAREAEMLLVYNKVHLKRLKTIVIFIVGSQTALIEKGDTNT